APVMTSALRSPAGPNTASTAESAETGSLPARKISRTPPSPRVSRVGWRKERTPVPRSLMVWGSVIIEALASDAGTLTCASREARRRAHEREPDRAAGGERSGDGAAAPAR